MAVPRLASRLMWFIGLWLAGVATVAAVGYAIKLALGS
jgi:hypothetical protein